MKSSIVAILAVLSLAGPAWAQAKADKPADKAAPPGGMDFSKMGPWTRKPTNEKQTKKEITEFFKQEEDLYKKGDHSLMLARVDFPVYMITDDAGGAPEGQAMSKDQYTTIMKPFWDNMPKDMKVTHKPTVTVLSDSLVTVTDDFTMTMGGKKLSGRNMGLLVKRDGQWKWKTMCEAGWGGMSPPSAMPAKK